MFRITFDHKTSTFRIQVLRFYLFWVALDTEGYSTYFQARKAVRDLGLDQIYLEQPPKPAYSAALIPSDDTQ